MEMITVATPRWMRWAQCADSDPALFHPEPGEDNGPRVEAARKICARCPVRVQCLIWSYETEDTFAILGGKTANQRRRIAARIKALLESDDFLPDAWLLLASA